MRMLALLATQPALLGLYQAQRAGSTQHEIDAGNNPMKHPGQGMGMNHAYFPAMVDAFNDLALVVDFPFEYFAPTLARACTLDQKRNGPHSRSSAQWLLRWIRIEAAQGSAWVS